MAEVEKSLGGICSTQSDLEDRARKVQERLEEAIDNGEKQWLDDGLLSDWLNLVAEKCQIWQKEAEMVHVWNQKYLDEFHTDIEFHLRCIIEKPESQKTEKDTKMEAALLELLLDVIERKNRLAVLNKLLVSPTAQKVEDERRNESPKILDNTFDSEHGENKGADKEQRKKKKLKLRLKKIKKKMAQGSEKRKQKANVTSGNTQ